MVFSHFICFIQRFGFILFVETGEEDAIGLCVNIVFGNGFIYSNVFVRLFFKYILIGVILAKT